MAKRQSFILEAKPLRTNEPKTEQSNLLSKQHISHNQVFESYKCYSFQLYFYWLEIPCDR